MKKIFLIVTFNLISMHSVAMLRRVASKVTPLTSSVLATQTRHLLPGQESNPLWIKANQEVENFRAQFRCPILTAAQINELEQKITANSLNKLSTLSLQQPHGFQKQKQLIIEQEVVRLLKKHSIDPSSIKIMFVSSDAAKKIKDLQVGLMAVSGKILVIMDLVFKFSQEEITAAIEHEIGHLICNDNPYLFVSDKIKDKYPRVHDYHMHLLERRADIHSGIQSRKNFESLCLLAQSNQGRSAGLKVHKIAPRLKEIAPQVMQNSEVVNMLRPYLNPLVFNQIKTVAKKEFNAGNISPEVLTEIIELCNQPTYMDDLRLFYEQQESTK